MVLRGSSDILSFPYEAHLKGGPWDGEIVGIDTPTPRLIGPSGDGTNADHIYTRKPLLGGNAPRVIAYTYAGRKLA